ncbi:MAG: acetylglutamate kinase [Anaerolineae bacterium]|nr:acetylglutamate kinase [Anaerolineae bacterium]
MTTSDLTLLKIGGAELQDGPVLDCLVEALVQLVGQHQLIVVHGGGRDIADLQKRLGIAPSFIDGLRITDDDSLWIAEMALSGTVNKRLTARLVSRGVRALGLSGVDAGLMRAAKLLHPRGDLGRVGEVTVVDTACLTGLLESGFTPIISPISLGDDGRALNVNADHAALAVASAMQVGEMILLTDVPGVLYRGDLLPSLSVAQANDMIAQGHITGGMIPKVRAALDAVARRVHSARITDLEGLAQGTGTWVTGE